MQKNGIILIDDYGEIEGATKAIDFFFKNKKYNIEKLNYYKRPSFIKIQINYRNTEEDIRHITKGVFSEEKLHKRLR